MYRELDDDEIASDIWNICLHRVTHLFWDHDSFSYGVATMSRLRKIIGLFCQRAHKRDYVLQKRPIILGSLLIVATPYHDLFWHHHLFWYHHLTTLLDKVSSRQITSDPSDSKKERKIEKFWKQAGFVKLHLSPKHKCRTLCLQQLSVSHREVGGWGRDPKKCTGRDWVMGSSTI